MIIILLIDLNRLIERRKKSLKLSIQSMVKRIAIYATSCKMTVFFALDMTIGPRVLTSGPTCRVQKNSHFATCFIQDFF
jgi:hypothetical protein